MITGSIFIFAPVAGHRKKPAARWTSWWPVTEKDQFEAGPVPRVGELVPSKVRADD